MRLPSLARPGMAYFPRRWHDRQMPSSTTAVTEHQVREARLAAQHLRGPRLPHLPAVVEHLVAVQSQEFWLSLWGLASRIGPTPDIADSRTAFDGGDVVRTHLLRPTWHTVTPRDARWLLALTGPRVRQVRGLLPRHAHREPRTRSGCHDGAALLPGRHRRGRAGRGALAPDHHDPRAAARDPVVPAAHRAGARRRRVAGGAARPVLGARAGRRRAGARRRPAPRGGRERYWYVTRSGVGSTATVCLGVAIGWSSS